MTSRDRAYAEDGMKMLALDIKDKTAAIATLRAALARVRERVEGLEDDFDPGYIPAVLRIIDEETP